MSATFVEAMRIGDSFYWCNRVVTLQRREWGGQSARGSSHWLHVWNHLEQEKLRLHYYDNEVVELATTPGES